MTPSDLQMALDELARDLDMVVYRLERQAPDTIDAHMLERSRLRHELELMHRRLEVLVRSADGLA